MFQWGENYSIVNLGIIMQRKLKSSRKNQSRQKSLSGSFVLLKKESGVSWSNNNAVNNDNILFQWEMSLTFTSETT